ncbi:MAG: recombinase family protein [Clostridia bacterium]|nr:recombinase family protein [Clostridia bacterium]
MNITNNVASSQTNVDKKKPKVAIYCRLSEEDRNKENEEDDSRSIQNQKLMLTEYAIRQEWDIQGIYSDDDYTGADRDRPDFNKILNLAEKRQIDIILCKSQSRFTRELELVERYIHNLFIEWNIRFVGLVDNADTNVKGNKKSRQINGLVNEWYLEDMSENIKSILQSKREQGLHTGGLALYGYLKDPDKKGHLIIDPVAAEVVREVFNLYNQGIGKTAIARELNNRGIPNPTQYKLQRGIAYKTPKTRLGTLWKYSAIASMLKNEMYIGNMVQGRYGSISYKSKKNKPKPREQWVIVEGTHEAIIDMDLWNSVQNKINKNFKPFLNGHIGVFAKKCKCEHCGYILKSSKSHNDRYLRCPTRQVNKNECVGCFISQKVLERIVLKEINEMIDKYLNKDKLEESIIVDNIRSKKDKLEEEIAQYQANLNKQSKAIKDLYLDKANGVITTEQFTEFNEHFKEEKENIEKLLKQKKSELIKFKDEQDILKSKRQLLEKYINVTELSREMMDNLIDYITVGVKDPITKKKPIKIYWKF